MAASVDDLPEPVGPVTSTMPFLSRRPPQPGGRFSRRASGSRRDDAHDDRVRAALAEDVDAEAAAVRAANTRGRRRPCLRVRERLLVAADQVAGDRAVSSGAGAEARAR